MTEAQLVQHWERRLAREGLAPLEERIRGRVVIRSEIIAGQEGGGYLREPGRLASALEAWLAGDPSHFTDDGQKLLLRPGRGGRKGDRWPRVRARILLRVC